MLDSAEHDFFSANRYENANNNWHMKMPTIIVIFIFISSQIFICNYVLQERVCKSKYSKYFEIY